MMAANTVGTTEALLERLRQECGIPGLRYAEAPAPLPGGYDTQMMRFRLSGAPSPLDERLVARIFRESLAAPKAEREARIHAAIVQQGYLAPPVLHASPKDEAPGAFIVMPLLKGTTLRAAMGDPRVLWRTPALLAKWHARLHALDASQLPADERSRAMDDWPTMLREQAERAKVAGFEPALAWAADNAPPPSSRSILHLDFHPGNVMVHKGAVSGVIDWANGTTGDPASDVGTTVALLTMGPVEAPALVPSALDALRKWLAGRYVAEYRRLNPIPMERVQYYEARRCLTAMLHVAIRRAGTTLGDRETYAWDGPQQIRKMTRRFQQITRIRLPINA
jgi:aminoglycoside phosphotransferase (APT) family kinase protein